MVHNIIIKKKTHYNHIRMHPNLKWAMTFLHVYQWNI